MRSRRLAGAAALALVVALGIPTAASAQEPGGRDRVEVYVGTVSPEQFELLRGIGVDPEDVVHGADGVSTEVEVPLTERQAARLASKGVKLAVKRIAGKTSSQLMREQSSRGWSAFRSYSEPGGIRDELTATAARHPKLAKLVTIGRTTQGKPILAVKVTKNARTTRDGARPSTAYVGAQHAREWITVEMNRRLLHHVLDSYGTDAAITNLLNRTELWFVPVANPDGYDYTFTEGNRLWRKNLRDNDGDGQITGVDGVDLNRNYAYKWGYDNEGSSPDPSSDTYRGPSANSEPETRALDGLFRRVGFEFFINYHSAAELLLYGIGWQVSTPSPDDVIYETMVGDDDNPAVPGYDPDISAELYTTNGDTDTHMTVRYGTLGFTPEMSTCDAAAASDPNDEWLPENCVSEFIFPDDEDLIQAEFAKNIPFALAIATSALDPDDPVSVVGRTTPDFVIDPFDVSYGTRQAVAVTARKALSRRQAELQGQRRSHPHGRHAGVAGWRALRRNPPRLLRGAARHGHRRQEGRFGRGLVHRPQTRQHGVQRPLHLHRQHRHRRRRADPGRRRRHRHQPGAAGDHRPIRRRGRLGAARRPDAAVTSTTSTPRAARLRTTWASCRTTRPWSGRPATTSSRGRPGRCPARRPSRRWRSSSPSATTSTRAASCCSRARTRCSHRAPTADTSTTRTTPSSRSAPRPTTYPCLPLFNDFQQYWLGAFSYLDDTGTTDEGTAAADRHRGQVHRVVGRAQRARLGREPGPHRVVPAAVELPAAGRLPVVRPDDGTGRLGPAGRTAVRARSRATGTPSADAVTRTTSGSPARST